MGQPSEDQKEIETFTYGGYRVRERQGLLGGWVLDNPTPGVDRLRFDCLGEFTNWVDLNREVVWKEVCRIENSRKSGARK